MGQELHSCDTTQIDVLETSARFTRHHACPMDNGWVPVGIYLVSRSSRPRKSIRPAAPRPDPTTQGSLKVCRTSYFSFSQVSLLFDCYGYYSGSAHLCQPPIFNSVSGHRAGASALRQTPQGLFRILGDSAGSGLCFVYGFTPAAASLLKAASSTTSTASRWSRRTEAGH